MHHNLESIKKNNTNNKKSVKAFIRIPSFNAVVTS